MQGFFSARYSTALAGKRNGVHLPQPYTPLETKAMRRIDAAAKKGGTPCAPATPAMQGLCHNYSGAQGPHVWDSRGRSLGQRWLEARMEDTWPNAARSQPHVQAVTVKNKRARAAMTAPTDGRREQPSTAAPLLLSPRPCHGLTMRVLPDLQVRG